MGGESWPADTAETAVCPNCDHRVRKLPTDEVLTCHSCGWQKRTPLSHIWRFLPSISMPRSRMIVPLGILLVSIVGLYQLGAAAAVMGGYEDITQPAPPDNSDPDVAAHPSDRINNSLVEDHFIEYLNNERRERGLQPVQERTVLTEMGKEQARDMALNDSYSHTNSDGQSIKDRYEERGLLPECRLPIDGEDRHYKGAENIAQSGVFVEYNPYWTDGIRENTNEKQLAYDLVRQWMASPSHRKAMLVYSAESAGLGIYITETGTVYAALELC